MPIAPPESPASVPTSVATPNKTGSTSSLPVTITTGTSVNGNSGSITIQAGASTNSTGGSVILRPGLGGDTNGVISLRDGVGTERLRLAGSTVSLRNSASFNTAAGFLVIAPATDPAQAAQLAQISPLLTIVAGALPTQQFVSGTEAQVSTTRDVEVHTPVTFNPGVATTATCKVELSPDNTTFSELCTWTEPVGVALDGTIHDVSVRVPAGWFLRLTATNAVLGLSTYY